jgi:membrane protease YdiL (CAAX protease family)
MILASIAPRLAHDQWVNLTNAIFFGYSTLSFILVAIYAGVAGRRHALVDTPASPPVFVVPGASGWFFILGVVLLLLDQSILYVLLVAMGISAFLALQNRTAADQFGFSRLSLPRLVSWSIIACGAVVALEWPLSIVIDRSMTALSLSHPEQNSVVLFRQAHGAQQIGLFLLQAVLIAPVIEEVFFRGFLFGFLKKYVPVGWAIVISAGIFALAHVNVGATVQLWVLGLMLALAYEHTGSLLLPIGIHGCWNFITALNLLLEKGGF